MSESCSRLDTSSENSARNREEVLELIERTRVLESEAGKRSVVGDGTQVSANQVLARIAPAG